MESYFANPSAPLIRALAVEVKELGKADRIQRLMEAQGCLASRFASRFSGSVGGCGRGDVWAEFCEAVEVWCSAVSLQRSVKYGSQVSAGVLSGAVSCQGNEGLEPGCSPKHHLLEDCSAKKCGLTPGCLCSACDCYLVFVHRSGLRFSQCLLGGFVVN